MLQFLSGNVIICDVYNIIFSYQKLFSLHTHIVTNVQIIHSTFAAVNEVGNLHEFPM